MQESSVQQRSSKRCYDLLQLEKRTIAQRSPFLTKLLLDAYCKTEFYTNRNQRIPLIQENACSKVKPRWRDFL